MHPKLRPSITIFVLVSPENCSLEHEMAAIKVMIVFYGIIITSTTAMVGAGRKLLLKWESAT